jgi:hypothetical protein
VTSPTDAVAPDRQSRIRVDTTYGGLYAGSSFEISEAVAAHFNRMADAATGVLPGEFRPFVAGDCFSIACPTLALSRPDFIEAYQTLRAVLDGETEILLSDHPRLLSTGLDDPGLIRGVPTYIPKDRMPDGFFGRAHSVELFEGEARIFGPVERFFHSPVSGPVFDQIEDGHGRLVVEIRGNLDVLAQRGEVVFFTDPAFGEPTSVVQVEADGSAWKVEWNRLGWDRVGDTTLFLEWVAVGVRPVGRSVVLELHFPTAATGLAAALFAGHTRDTAFRADATVLAG